MSGDQDFFERVWEITKQIPVGMVTTYGHIAAAMGSRSSARTVGWALHAAAGRDDIPAHRVVNRKGLLTGKGHFATPTLMRELLVAEGITFDGERVHLERHLWIPPFSRQTDHENEHSRVVVVRVEQRIALRRRY